MNMAESPQAAELCLCPGEHLPVFLGSDMIPFVPLLLGMAMRDGSPKTEMGLTDVFSAATLLCCPGTKAAGGR